MGGGDGTAGGGAGAGFADQREAVVFILRARSNDRHPGVEAIEAMLGSPSLLRDAFNEAVRRWVSVPGGGVRIAELRAALRVAEGR